MSPGAPRLAAPRALALLAAATLLAAALVLVPGAARAQERADSAPERTGARGCHCVDDQGQPIEGCVCFQAPRSFDVTVAPMPPMPPSAPEAMAWAMAMPRRARLGVTLGSPDRDQVGAPVEDVLDGGPADRVGLKAGDVIVGLDGHDLSEPVEGEAEGHLHIRGNPSVPRLLSILEGLEPGEAVDVTYVRDGQRHTATLTPEASPGWQSFQDMGDRFERMGERFGEMGAQLGKLPAPDVRVHVAPGPPGVPMVFRSNSGRCPEREGGSSSPWGRTCVAGAELLPVNPSLGAYFGAEKGVLVPDVADDSPLGLQAGDVIVAIGGRPVEAPDDVRRILASYRPDEDVTFRVIRRHETVDVRGHVEE